MTEEKRKHYAIELILTGRKLMKEKGFDAAKPILPYLLQIQENGFLPLNRYYKPLGVSENFPWDDYEKYEFLLIPKDQIKNLHRLENHAHCKDKFFFFSDITHPMGHYNRRRYLEFLDSVFGFI